MRLNSFPGIAQVVLANGQSCLMKDLKKGDQVYVLKGGRLCTENITGFFEKTNRTLWNCLKVTLDNNECLYLAPSQYINTGHKYVRGDQLVIGDQINYYLLDGNMSYPLITSIKVESHQGKYSPIPRDGSVLVNSVCFSDTRSDLGKKLDIIRKMCRSQVPVSTQMQLFCQNERLKQTAGNSYARSIIAMQER